MTSREKLLRNPIYWFDHEQNEIYRQVSDYLERENINKTELSERLKVHKSHISQMLNGNFNPTLKKLTELFLAIGVVPRIKYDKIEDVIKKDNQLKSYYDLFMLKSEKDNIIPLSVSKESYSSSAEIEEIENSDINSFNPYSTSKNAPSFSREVLNLIAV